MVGTDLPSIEALLRRMPESKLRVRITGTGPDAALQGRVRLADVADLRPLLHGSGTLHLQAVDLHEFDPGFAQALARFRERVEAEVPECSARSTRATIGLFLSSGGAVAPFHADGEHNFLSQVTGDKHMHLFPADDLGIFTPQARERLASEDEHVLPTYRPELERLADVVHLVPGTTLYHPPMAPHWVDTGRASYSLSVTASFITPSVQRLYLLHKLNRRLRRLGLSPSNVGARPARDAAKLWLARVLAGLAGRRAA